MGPASLVGLEADLLVLVRPVQHRDVAAPGHRLLSRGPARPQASPGPRSAYPSRSRHVEIPAAVLDVGRPVAAERERRHAGRNHPLQLEPRLEEVQALGIDGLPLIVDDRNGAVPGERRSSGFRDLSEDLSGDDGDRPAVPRIGEPNGDVRSGRSRRG